MPETVDQLQTQLQGAEIPQLPQQSFGSNLAEGLPLLLAAIADLQGGTKMATPLIQGLQDRKQDRTKQNLLRARMQNELTRSKLSSLMQQMGLKDDLASSKLQREQSAEKHKVAMSEAPIRKDNLKLMQQKYKQDISQSAEKHEEWRSLKEKRKDNLVQDIKERVQRMSQAKEEHELNVKLDNIKLEKQRLELEDTKYFSPLRKEEYGFKMNIIKQQQQVLEKKIEADAQEQENRITYNLELANFAQEAFEEGRNTEGLLALQGDIQPNETPAQRMKRLKESPAAYALHNDFNVTRDQAAAMLEEDLDPRNSEALQVLKADASRATLHLNQWWKKHSIGGVNGLDLYDENGFIREEAVPRYKARIKKLINIHFDGDFAPNEDLYWLLEASEMIKGEDSQDFINEMLGVEEPERPKKTKLGKREASYSLIPGILKDKLTNVPNRITPEDIMNDWFGKPGANIKTGNFPKAINIPRTEGALQ